MFITLVISENAALTFSVVMFGVSSKEGKSVDEIESLNPVSIFANNRPESFWLVVFQQENCLKCQSKPHCFSFKIYSFIPRMCFGVNWT